VFASIIYSKKDGDLGLEKGIPPVSRKRKGEQEIERWSLARIAASEGRFQDIPDDIYFRYVNNAHKIHQLAIESRFIADNPELENYWYYGPSGSGKSRSAREKWPNAYLKMKNKWWNGYLDQDVAIIDDIDPSHEVWIGAFLKEWTDHYRFQAETKGGTRVIRPKIIVVTSQYSIEQIFKDPETVTALERRFTMKHFKETLYGFFPSKSLK